MKELCKGLTVEENLNGFTVLRLHYSADPDKDYKWAEEARKGYLTDIWNQEMELDFTKATGRRVFPEFKRDLHIKEVVFNPLETVWRGWDFGYHHPAVVWFQVDADDSPIILAELLGSEVVINSFAKDVVRLSKKLFPGCNFLDAGDPAVRAKNDKSLRTSADILRQFNIRIQTRSMPVRDGINIIRTLLLPRPDGEAKFRISPSCQLLISGFMGEYLRDEATDNPVKDGYMEHIFDALRYGMSVVFNPKTFQRNRPGHFFTIKRSTASSTTGY